MHYVEYVESPCQGMTRGEFWEAWVTCSIVFHILKYLVMVN